MTAPSLNSLIRRRVKVPTKEEERDLIEKAQKGDLEARNELIERNMPFVINFSTEHYMRLSPSHIESEDLIQACVFGLIRAIKKYDFDKNSGRFIGYAKYWLRHFMDHEIHYSKAYRMPQSSEYEFDRGGIKGESTRKACENFQEMGFLAENYDTHDTNVGRDPLELEEEILLLEEALSTLSEDNWELLHKRYAEGKTLKVIGQDIGRTKERVRQLLVKVKEQLIEYCKDYVGEI